MNRPVALALSLAATTTVAMTLAGCGSKDDGGGGGGMAIGASAKISYYALTGDSTAAQGDGTIAITKVTKGSSTDLSSAGFDLDDDQKSATPYYVDVTFANQGTQQVDLREPSGEDGHGNLIDALTVISLGGPKFAPCPGVPRRLAAGSTVDGCSIILVPSGSDLKRISYFPGGSDDFLYWKSGQ